METASKYYRTMVAVHGDYFIVLETWFFTSMWGFLGFSKFLKQMHKEQLPFIVHRQQYQIVQYIGEAIFTSFNVFMYYCNCVDKCKCVDNLFIPKPVTKNYTAVCRPAQNMRRATKLV